MTRRGAFARSAGLGILAVSQPLYALLNASPEFFAARAADSIDITMLCLAILLPALLWGAGGALAPRLGPLAAAVGAAALLAAQATASLPPLLALAACAAAGAAALWAVNQTHAEQYTGWLAAAALACPVLFLLGAPWPRTTAPTPTPARAATPVVVLVLDEFPLATLLDKAGGIDERWFPSFARLSREAAWYREARTVSDDTFKAVPALLSGQLPRPPQAPWHRDFPTNLFTLLAQTHALDVVETHTSLCPPSLCQAGRPSRSRRLRSAAADLAILYAHRVTPRAWAGGLPSIAYSWKEFSWDALNAEAGESFLDRAGAAKLFLARLKSGGLHFLHLMLPHPPWVYFPSGRAAFAPNEPIVMGDGGRADRWTDDEATVLAAWQRHILQARFVDSLVGQLIENLKAVGAWEDALVVVAADHGASFRRGGRRRERTNENAGEILPIPLFIKFPGKGLSGAQEREASLIDVLPTMLAALGRPFPSSLEGIDLRAASAKRSLEFIVKDGSRIPALEAWTAARREADRRRALLGDGAHPAAFYGLGPARGLLGTPVREAASSACRLALEQDLHGASGFSRAYLSGALSCPGRTKGRLAVAAATGSRFVATALSDPFTEGTAAFRMVLPEEGAAAGPPLLYEVRETSGGYSSAPLTVASEAWKLEPGGLRASNGRTVALDPPARGRLDALLPQKDVLVVRGDSRHEPGGPAADAVLVFARGEFLYGGRPDAKTGRFDFALPREAAQDLRVFALRDGRAWELAP